MPSLNEQEDAIAELVATKQYKQALNLCEKKLKKTKNNEYLLAKKIEILLKWPDEARREQGAKEIDTLLVRKPPLTNIDALILLDSIKYHRESKKIQQLWQRAATTRSNDEKLFKMWYWAKLIAGNLEDAQQATFQWKKNFPEQRGPHFLYIFVTHLISRQQDNDKLMRLPQSLAYKHLKSSADAALDEGTGKSARAIDTSEDLLFLLRIYRAQGKYDEAFLFLQSFMDLPKTKHNWDHARQLIELASLTQRWEFLWNFCFSILGDALKVLRDPSTTPERWGKLGDDWKIWDALVRAMSEMHDSVKFALTQEIISRFKDEGTRARNAYLALVKLHVLEINASRGTQDRLLTACTEYVLTFSCKVTCFQDIHQYIPHLDTPNQSKLIKSVGRYALGQVPFSGTVEAMTKWLTIEINIAKFNYHLFVSREDVNLTSDLLLAFICNCVRLYRMSLQFRPNLPVSDRLPGDDAALLAAMGLIRLYRRDTEEKSSKGGKALFRSIVLLEHMVSHSKHNYDALLILVRLYMFFGAGSLAMERYTRLSIKNMQHATISWVLFTHISTVHPHPTTVVSADGNSQITINPLEDIADILQWYRTAEALSNNSLKTMQDSGLWNMSLDAFETKREICSNFTRCQLLIEERRIRRFTGLSRDVQSQSSINLPIRTANTMDTGPFPSFEANSQPRFEQILPDPNSANLNDRWLAYELKLARLWDILHSNGNSPIDFSELQCMADASVSQQENYKDTAANIVSDLLGELDGCYRLNRYGTDTNVIKHTIDRLEGQYNNAFPEMLLNIQNVLLTSSGLSPDMSLPTGHTFRITYVVLEICHITVLSLNYVLAENRKNAGKPKRLYVDHEWLEQKAQLVQEQCKALSGQAYHIARAVQAELSRPATLQEFGQKVLAGLGYEEADDLVGNELRTLGDRAAVMKVCTDLRESWIEGLDGVIKTKFA